MEVKEAIERIIVAKPVASRPNCSMFRSFTELLVGAIDTSPPASVETPMPAIRPKISRFRPMSNLISAQIAFSKAENHELTTCSPNEMKPHSIPTVVYKPLAKLAPKTVVPSSMDQEKHMQINIEKQRAEACIVPNIFEYNLSTPERGSTEPLNVLSQNNDVDQRFPPLSTNGDQSAYDGYNWRKYGQKQVKGSEYPRSYYKCTHPSCPVKKKVERSFDGLIAEIVYKGEHNHPKPPTPKCSSSAQMEDPVLDAVNRDINISWKSNFSHANEIPEVKAHTISGFGSSEISNADNCDDGENCKEGNDNRPCNKRRKMERQCKDAVEEGKIVVESSMETDVRGDGFRWRKYGQKVVRGNPYPRSYYRCTALKCNVRKYVERVSDDPQAFVTTYEGKHCHGMPAKGSPSLGSASDLPAMGKKNNAEVTKGTYNQLS